MGISKYEAVALYDSHENNREASYLIIDLDDTSYGFCRCNAQGNTELLHKSSLAPADLWRLCIAETKKVTGDTEAAAFETALREQLLSGKNVLYNYIISDRLIDAPLLHFAETSVNCRSFEDAMTPVRTQLDALTKEARRQIAEADLNSCRIILIGKAADIYLFEYYVRENLSADPLLPDARFVNAELKDPASEIAAIGMQIHEDKSLVQRSYSLSIFDAETNDMREIISIARGQKLDSLQDIRYFGPVLLAKNDPLLVKIDDKDTAFRLPYTIDATGFDLIDLGAGVVNGRLALSIRRCRCPDQIYTIAL